MKNYTQLEQAKIFRNVKGRSPKIAERIQCWTEGIMIFLSREICNAVDELNLQVEREKSK